MNGINKTKIGFNYFQDFDHYQESDAQQWIPILKDLNANWLVLNVPTDRTISDVFIKAMRNAGIELILHFKFSLKELPNIDDFRSIIKNYATWAFVMSPCLIAPIFVPNGIKSNGSNPIYPNDLQISLQT